MADSRLRRDKNLNINVARWRSKSLKTSLWVIKYGKKFWFFGKEVAEALEYVEPKRAIQDHVDYKDKKSIEELLGRDYKSILLKNISEEVEKPLTTFFLRLQKNYNVISEIGLYILCTRSRKDKVVPFQRWIYETIETIRETGSYTLPCGAVDNPLSLVDKVSNLEREIETLKKRVETCDKETQTPKTIDPIKLKSRLEKSIRKTREIEIKLEKSLREINYNPSSRSNSSSSSRYSSDSN